MSTKSEDLIHSPRGGKANAFPYAYGFDWFSVIGFGVSMGFLVVVVLYQVWQAIFNG